MGKKGAWFGAVKKVLSPESKQKCQDDQITPRKPNKKWFGRQRPPDLGCTAANRNGPSVAPPPPTPVEDNKRTEAENEQNKRAQSVALANAAAAEAAVVAALAAAEVVRLTSSAPKCSGKPREEAAAVKIQSVFRGYMARRASRALRGLVRLKTVAQGDSAMRQVASALRQMQTLARVQSQVRSRRIARTEQANQALQRQLQLKRDRELEALKASVGEAWDDSLQSREEIEAHLVSKHEAAAKRERALAYAYTHQWNGNGGRPRSANSMSTLFTEPNWGWSWLGRWTAQWPSRHAVEGGRTNDGIHRFAFRQLTSGTPHRSTRDDALGLRSSTGDDQHRQRLPEDDALSLRSERNRRHSNITGSDDESLESLPYLPAYMTPTRSTRAKSRFQGAFDDIFPDRASVKKRLSLPATENKMAAASRRHSDAPKAIVGAVSIAGRGS